MAVIIQLRRDTAANWTSNNPTLAAGELAIETDTAFYKIGDGSTAWTSLGVLLATVWYCAVGFTCINRYANCAHCCGWNQHYSVSYYGVRSSERHVGIGSAGV